MSQVSGVLSKGWWVGLGVILASLIGIVTIWIMIAQGSARPSDAGPVESQDAPPVVESTSPEETPVDSTPVDSVPVEDPPTSPTVSPPEPPAVLYLKDMDDDAFVREPHWVWDSSGAASIGGVTYANSLIYEFQNCSSCDEPLEFIVPAGYQRLTGVFGLGDESRHDDVIDGIVYVAVYDAAGNQLLAPQFIEYPGSIPIDVDITGQPRVRIQMSEGTNFEHFVLGDVALRR